MNDEIFPNDKSHASGPGILLQTAREEKNLRHEDVAYEIRLTSTQVAALEEDDYSKMPEATYVRGYLRNYARLVGVPENDILMSFARITRSVDTDQKKVVLTTDNGQQMNQKLVVAVVLSAVLVIAGVGLLWLQGSEESAPESEAMKVSVAEVENKDLVNDQPVGVSTVNINEIREAAQPIAPTVTRPETPGKSGDSTSKKEDVAKETDSPASVENLNKAPMQNTLTNSGTASSDSVSNNSESQTNNPAGQGAQGGVLLLTFSKDSWTDVRDANGKKLLYRTAKAGEKIALAGKLPISVFFGFAQGVNVKFNGDIVDVGGYTRGVFARFTVGEKVRD